MMKRRDLLKKLDRIAREQGETLEEVREGGSHTIYRVGPKQFPVPRHNEINELTAKSILKQIEDLK